MTPSTIYRRWGDLSALLADVAVERLRPISDPEDTGAVTSDLRLFIEQFMEEMSSPGRPGADEGSVFPFGTRPIRSSAAAFTQEHLATIVARAKARGETPFDIDEVIDHVVAPIIYHILYGDRELTLDYCHSLWTGFNRCIRSLTDAAAHDRRPPARSRPRIKSDALSAIIMVEALRLAEIIRGMIDASTTRRPCSPCTRS